MKKLFVTLFSIICICASICIVFGASEKEVAFADDDTIYVYIAPSNLKDNEFAGQTTVAVRDNDDESVLFYLIESYYYPVKKVGRSYQLKIDGADLNAYIEADDLITAPTNYSFVNLASALPLSPLKTDGDIVVNGQAVNSANGWTVKLAGLNGNDAYVYAMKGNVTACGLVATASFIDFSVPYHPVAQAERDGLFTETPDETDDNIDTPKTSVALRIILIIGIIIPAVLIAILLFKPNKNYDNKTQARERKATSRSEYDNDRAFDKNRNYNERDNVRDYRNDDYRDYRRDDRDDRRYRSENDSRR